MGNHGYNRKLIRNLKNLIMLFLKAIKVDMACAVIDPRMMDLVWTDRLEYEALLHKRPSCTQAQPSSAPSAESSAPSANEAVTAPKKSSKESSVKADGKSE